MTLTSWSILKGDIRKEWASLWALETSATEKQLVWNYRFVTPSSRAPHQILLSLQVVISFWIKLTETAREYKLCPGMAWQGIDILTVPYLKKQFALWLEASGSAVYSLLAMICCTCYGSCSQMTSSSHLQWLEKNKKLYFCIARFNSFDIVLKFHFCNF